MATKIPYLDDDDDLPPSKPIKAGAEAHSYLRFSEKRQGRGDSRRRQQDDTRRFAEKYGLRLQDTSYEDLGLSAYDGTNVEKARSRLSSTQPQRGQFAAAATCSLKTSTGFRGSPSSPPWPSCTASLAWASGS